ncbi:MAG: DUF305 domain-containing protein [Patescibacteria group bacterium]|nr:DUF305 domain-containing protein [Patescibacteria group bacterium]
MVNKSLLYGIGGFIAGGLLVSIAATTFDKNDTALTSSSAKSTDSMSHMVASLEGKTGNTYDKAFMAEMIKHHESAVAMAKLSNGNAKHQEIKDLSTNIIAAQETEIKQMQQWQKDWGYNVQSDTNSMHGMEH